MRFPRQPPDPNPESVHERLWAASTSCLYAGVSVEELRGRYMRAYGGVSPAAADELERLVAELTDVLQKMNGYFAGVKK